MFVFAIETCGRTVAFTKETDRVMLDGVLNGQREEGQHLRDGLLYLRNKIGARLWDGSSPFTARLATDSEELDYQITAREHQKKEQDISDDESILMFHISDEDGASALLIPPVLRRAA
jgi:hypothetical protein